MTYPDDNPKTIYGTAKPSLIYVPPVALFKLGQVMEIGANKYGPMNWRDAKVTRSTYINAALRHIFEDWDGDDLDSETHLENLAHAAACLCIVLDAKAQGTLNDDRPSIGMMSAFLRQNTKQITKDT
jgi:hypothetical protein